MTAEQRIDKLAQLAAEHFITDEEREALGWAVAMLRKEEDTVTIQLVADPQTILAAERLDTICTCSFDFSRTLEICSLCGRRRVHNAA